MNAWFPEAVKLPSGKGRAGRPPALGWTVGVWEKHRAELRVWTWITEVLGVCAFGAEGA